MSSADLEQIIADSVNDANLETETVDSTSEVETSPETPVEATETASEETSEVEAGEDTTSVEVESPAARAAKQEKDTLEGIPAHGASGRENRIPHSRVTKMVAKAVKDAEDKFAPKLQEYESKVADYEGRLQKVAEFENLMINDSQKFLQLLNQLPQFQELLKPVFAPKPAAETVAKEAVPEDDGMPQPDYVLADGSKVYSMEGLKQLNAWNRAKAREEARNEVLAEIDKRFGPIEKSFQAHRQFEELAPKIQAQIAEAKTWPLFNENENEITQALQQDRRLSLEGAYRKVVFPKITADRNKMREQIMAEIKKAPTSTAAPSRVVKSAPVAGGKRSLEDIVRAQAEEAGLI